MNIGFTKFLLIAALAGAGAGTGASLQAQGISQWTFELSVPTTAGPHTAEMGANPGQALGFHAATSAYSNPAGNGSVESFSSNAWAPGDYYQFTLSTVGFSNIFVTFSSVSSNTGPAQFTLQYSLGGSGGTFIDFSPYLNSATPAFNSATYQPEPQKVFDLSAVAGLNNNPSVAFRMVNTSTLSANGGTVASTGTSRVDDFYVSANTPIVVPEPGTYALLGIGGLICVQRFRRRKV